MSLLMLLHLRLATGLQNWTTIQVNPLQIKSIPFKQHSPMHLKGRLLQSPYNV